MAEISRKRVGELFQGVLRILAGAPDGMRARDVLQKLESVVPPTGFERGEYPNRPGLRRYEKTVRFATIGPVKAGWMVKTKGRWIITEEGKKALDRFADPEQFSREATRLYRAWAADREKEDEVAEAVDAPDDVRASSAFEDAEGAAWEEIEAYVSKMDPYDFQKLVAGLLRAMAYHIAWNAPPGPDGGVDIVAYSDPLGAREPVVKVAVRRRKEKTDVKDVREFLSLLHGSDVGICVSIAGFTKPAEDLARQEQRKIRLVDLERMFDLWTEHYPKIDDAAQQLLPLRPIWFLAPNE